MLGLLLGAAHLLLGCEVLAQLALGHGDMMLGLLLGAVYPLTGCEVLAQLAKGQADDYDAWASTRDSPPSVKFLPNLPKTKLI